MKEFIAGNPQVLQALPSGDCVDVLFQNGDAWIAVEVKARRSPEADVVRGIFQAEALTCLMRGGAPAFHRGLSALLEVEVEGRT